MRALVHLFVLSILAGCSGGGTALKAPQGGPDAAVTRRPDVAAVPPRELRALPVTPLPVGLDGVAGITRAGKLLYVYGTDLADRSFKRLSVNRAGDVKVLKLQKIAKLDHPFDLQRCAGQRWVTKATHGPANQWRLQRLDLLLAPRGAPVVIPRLNEPGWVVPKLLCDGATGWLIWSTAKQTRIQIRRGGKWVATLQLRAPDRGWPRYMSPEIRAVAWRGKLYLLRSSTRGLEAILVGPTGELRRVNLITQDLPSSPSVALARVDQRFLAVWVERGLRRRSRFRGPPGRVLGRWLDASFKPMGSEQNFAKRVSSSNISLHLWANHKGQLLLGRTIRYPQPLMGGGFRYTFQSYLSGYDVARTRLGPWRSLGSAPINSGQWVGDTLHVLMDGLLAGGQTHLRRFRFQR